MKICIITDTHLGARNNCFTFNDYFLRFYKEIFFPYLIENEIKVIIHAGDLGEFRKNVNTAILDSWNEHVFEPLSKFKCYFIAGNHDLFYKQMSTVTLQSSLQLDKKYGFELINASPRTITLDNRQIDLIPWITTNNRAEIEEFIKASTSPLLIAHLEASGAIISPGTLCQESQLETNLLTKYHKVISGHFHIRSLVNNIIYIGNPYQIVWSDYGYDKGFVILDTDDLSLTYINNPLTIFEKITSLSNSCDFSSYSNKHIKLIINQDVKKSLVETFIIQLEKYKPLSISIQETDITISPVEENIQSKDTIDYIKVFVDNLYSNQQMRLDKNKLLNIITEIYQQAQTLTIY